MFLSESPLVHNFFSTFKFITWIIILSLKLHFINNVSSFTKCINCYSFQISKKNCSWYKTRNKVKKEKRKPSDTHNIYLFQIVTAVYMTLYTWRETRICKILSHTPSQSPLHHNKLGRSPKEKLLNNIFYFNLFCTK